jgi:hypothetical protein
MWTHTGVIKTVDPSFAVWLSTFNRTDIVRFSIIIPSHYLDDVDVIAGGNQIFPPGGVQVRIGKVNPLRKGEQDADHRRRRRCAHFCCTYSAHNE